MPSSLHSHRSPGLPSPSSLNRTRCENSPLNHAPRSGNPRRRRVKKWEKLLWVEQDCDWTRSVPSLLYKFSDSFSVDPDNWVDPTFLKDLQRNINVHPYDFYSLVAESTVIVQHLSSVVIFVTSFIAIFQERTSPVSVVSVSSVLTIAGWAVWELGWTKRETAKERPVDVVPVPLQRPKDYSSAFRQTRIMTTAKSALLIYFTLLGLSPILRSLTSSISKDSIWAIATWLFIANFLGFDYGSGVEQKFPASFSTNAAITAAVVLASTLPSTQHVFSLMLFSIQIFGLFPVFRRYIKHISWNLHVLLTVFLVLGAGTGLGVMVGLGWAVLWVLSVIAGMVGCAWWMIDLQKYKNEIHGPWDPARPVVRRQWE